jgi:hypothetical protein
VSWRENRSLRIGCSQDVSGPPRATLVRQQPLSGYPVRRGIIRFLVVSSTRSAHPISSIDTLRRPRRTSSTLKVGTLSDHDLVTGGGPLLLHLIVQFTSTLRCTSPLTVHRGIDELGTPPNSKTITQLGDCEPVVTFQCYGRIGVQQRPRPPTPYISVLHWHWILPIVQRGTPGPLSRAHAHHRRHGRYR